jgi:hypothetical protein
VKPNSGSSNRFILPLPAFVLHPLTALFLGALHVYLAAGHLSKYSAALYVGRTFGKDSVH